MTAMFPTPKMQLVLHAELTQEEASACRALARLSCYREEERAIPFFLSSAKKAIKAIMKLDHPVRRATQLLVDGRADMVVIKGLPVGDLPEVPDDGTRPPGKCATTELALLGILGSVGALPLAYKQENHGRLVHQIAPQKGKETEKTFAGRAEQAMHSDNPGLLRQYRQQFLGLMGLVNDLSTPTKFIAVDDLVQALNGSVVAKLREPCIKLHMPNSFKFGYQILGRARPVLWTDEQGRNHISFHETSAVALPGYEDAFAALLDAIHGGGLQTELVCHPGTLIYFSDSRWLHGRAAVTEGRRWIQRAYFRRDLSCLRRACPGSRFVFDTRNLLKEDDGMLDCG